MSDGVRIKLSAGLLAVALLHAVAIVGMFEAVHRSSRAPGQPLPWNVPLQRTPEPSIGKLAEPAAVNLHAQGEVKQQCIDCTPAYVRPAPRIIRPSPTYVQPSPTIVLPAPTYVQPARTPPTLQPSILVQPTNSNPQPPAKEYQLVLFLGSDAKSQQLLDWFNQDPRLQAMRKSCEFQVFTASNPLYKARFAADVPVEQFPVVLLQDKNGGHIHAAGHSMIPSTIDALYADFRKGFELYQQARQAQKTGAIKSRGYSWDAAISPTMQLRPGDCPDGFCPDPSQDSWQPGQRIRDLLFDTTQDTRDALLWTSASEIATVALLGVAVVLIGIIIMRRISA